MMIRPAAGSDQNADDDGHDRPDEADPGRAEREQEGEGRLGAVGRGGQRIETKDGDAGERADVLVLLLCSWSVR
jgi:hypothetical protein